jgi:SAM-dependent methyltransferase
MRQIPDDFEARFRARDTPWEDPQPWLFARLVPSGARILDVGCGLGTNALRLAALGHRVLGVDVSPTAIEQALVRRGAGSGAQAPSRRPGPWRVANKRNLVSRPCSPRRAHHDTATGHITSVSTVSARAP